MITKYSIAFRVLADDLFLQNVCFFSTVDQISVSNFCHLANTHFPSKCV